MRIVSIVLLLMMCACQTPQRSYVEADAESWKHIDKHVDKWIDNEESFKDAEKEALHKLMEARRVRIKNALRKLDK